MANGYSFRDFGQKAAEPSPSIQAYFDDSLLDEDFNVPGATIRTLSVAGRGSATYSAVTHDVYGRDGLIIRENKLEPRTITVRALVRAKTNAAYRELMAGLNSYLFSRYHTLSFTDNDGYYYFGAISRVEDEGEKSNIQIVELEFKCYDPFRYTDVFRQTIATGDYANLNTDLAITPDEIRITFPNNTAAGNFYLVNTTRMNTIAFDLGSAAPGNTVIIDIKENFIGYSESVNYIRGLDVLNSTFDDFKIGPYDVLSVSPDVGAITVTYRGASL